MKKILQAAVIGTILLTLIIPTAIGNIYQNIKPVDVKRYDGDINLSPLMDMEMLGPGDGEELLEPGIFDGTVTQWHINFTEPPEIWKMPMGEIEGCIGVGQEMGTEVNYFSATWDSPFSTEPFRLHGLIKNGYIIGQIFGRYPSWSEDLFSRKISGFYRINHHPNEENPGDFYIQLLIQYWPGDYQIEGHYTLK